MSMWRNINDIGNEIANQILISEICFNICKSIPKIYVRGNDFLPFYYNLNFLKGTTSLYSLLLSNSPDELSIKNYLKKYRLDFPSVNIDDFEAEIVSISKSFKDIFPMSMSLRHNVFAHTDQKFTHRGFTREYIIPESVEKHILLIQNLKKLFFNFCNYAQDYPSEMILNQTKSIVKMLTDNFGDNYTGGEV